MLGNYSKLIGALVGNAVAILAIYLAASWPAVATCTLQPDGSEACVILGFTQADLTMAVMAVLNTVFVFVFPPNKETVKSLALVGVLVLTTTALVACVTLSPKQEEAVQKAYKQTCDAEPAVYSSYMTIAVAKGYSEQKLARATAIHKAFTNDEGTGLCQTRPTDFATVSIRLAALYAELVTLSAKLDG
jgi:hypothetical protein